ncbi:hypothetical protein B0H12DRAFT_851413 [Mycena haematopus]|nr:hypothetical protein B0H12DRAFT_851413 [Mycena haematopus]
MGRERWRRTHGGRSRATRDADAQKGFQRKLRTGNTMSRVVKRAVYAPPSAEPLVSSPSVASPAWAAWRSPTPEYRRTPAIGSWQARYACEQRHDGRQSAITRSSSALSTTDSDASMLPASIPSPLAPMALSALCSWVRNGSPELQTALITDVSWWEESQTTLKHQFLILRFTLGGTFYDIKVERAGKSIVNPARRAIDRATITPAAPFDEAFYKAHSLLFSLLTHRDLVQGCRHSFSTHSLTSWTTNGPVLPHA